MTLWGTKTFIRQSQELLSPEERHQSDSKPAPKRALDMAKQKRSTVGQEILHGAREALAAIKGDTTAVRVTIIPRIDVGEIRRRLKMTQAEFSRAFGLSLDSVKNWEQGHRVPEGPAKVLLAVIAKDPKAVQNALATYR
jgi:putative transcriptional regulator